MLCNSALCRALSGSDEGFEACSALAFDVGVSTLVALSSLHGDSGVVSNLCCHWYACNWAHASTLLPLCVALPLRVYTPLGVRSFPHSFAVRAACALGTW